MFEHTRDPAWAAAFARHNQHTLRRCVVAEEEIRKLDGRAQEEVLRDTTGGLAILRAIRGDIGSRLSMQRTHQLALLISNNRRMLPRLLDAGIADVVVDSILSAKRDDFTALPPWLYAIDFLRAIIFSEDIEDPRLACIRPALPGIVDRIWDDRDTFSSLVHRRAALWTAAFLRTVSETYYTAGSCVTARHRADE